MMRAILGRILRRSGFDVTETADCLAALEHMKADGPPDLVTLDWNMPDMTGLEFLAMVRAETAYNDMRILMVTSETEMTQIERALQAGANEYVMKPFTAAAIREKLLLLGILPETKPA
jgi:two-component system chemotaxis response regulator CheY